MNAERLHAVSVEVLDDIGATAQVAALTRMDQALTRLAQNPQDQAAQVAVAGEREAIRDALATAPSNDASPGRRQILDELGVSEHLGANLFDRVNSIIDGNEMTPASAQASIAEIVQEQEGLQSELLALIQSFEYLGIGREELAVGEWELAILIPRRSVDDALGQLGVEFVALKKILDPFAELAEQGRPLIHVRSISSSDFMVFLEAAEATAKLVASVTAILIGGYKSIMKIRSLISSMRDEGVDEEELAPAVANANRRIEVTIKEQVEVLLEESDLSASRKNEMRTELTRSLWGIALRIDDGYNIDLRVGLPEPADDDEHEDPLRSEIRELRSELQFLKLEGDSILSLPSSLDEGEDPDGPTEAGSATAQ